MRLRPANLAKAGGHHLCVFPSPITCKKNSLMLQDWLVFGPENGNRIDILFEGGVGAEVSVRCDVREEAPQFLVLVSDLVRFHGCRFFSVH